MGGGVFFGNFEKKKPMRFQDPVFWAWLEIVFFPKRCQFYYDTFSHVIDFGPMPLKVLQNAVAVDLERMNTPRDIKSIKTAFINP